MSSITGMQTTIIERLREQVLFASSASRASEVRRRYALRDDQWEAIKDLLPGREEAPGVTAGDNRLFVEAVLYRYRAGIAWRDWPERFGHWKNVHQRFSRWAKAGGWERLLRHLAADADKEYAMMDRAIVRAHQHGAGAVKKKTVMKPLAAARGD